MLDPQPPAASPEPPSDGYGAESQTLAVEGSVEVCCWRKTTERGSAATQPHAAPTAPGAGRCLTNALACLLLSSCFYTL